MAKSAYKGLIMKEKAMAVLRKIEKVYLFRQREKY